MEGTPASGGVARRMVRFATTLVGHWHGGLALAGVIACARFAAVSGSSPATVVAIGSVMLPAMLREGFPRDFGAGVITTSGALGILIPPSIAMVTYSVCTNASVGAPAPRQMDPGRTVRPRLTTTIGNRRRTVRTGRLAPRGGLDGPRERRRVSRDGAGS